MAEVLKFLKPNTNILDLEFVYNTGNSTPLRYPVIIMNKTININLHKYDELITFITSNLPKQYHYDFNSELNTAKQDAFTTGSTNFLERVIGDWHFTAEIESDKKLKKMFLESEKRGASKNTYSIEDVFGE